MSTKSKIIALAALFIIILSIPLYLIISNENHLSNTEFQYKFRRIYPVDPYDPMRGRYITLHLFQTGIPVLDGDSLKRGDEVHVVVDRDSLGWAYFKNAQKSIPDVPNYFTTKVTSFWNDGVSVQIPFERYYLNEELAPAAEKEYNSLVRQRDSTLYLVVTIKDGKALSNNLYYKEELFIDYLKRIEKERSE